MKTAVLTDGAFSFIFPEEESVTTSSTGVVVRVGPGDSTAHLPILNVGILSDGAFSVFFDEYAAALAAVEEGVAVEVTSFFYGPAPTPPAHTNRLRSGVSITVTSAFSDLPP